MLLLLFSLALSLISVNSPMLLNILLILIALITGLIVNSLIFSWFAFIVFLLYVGGILVIFIYFSSLTPNHYFKIKPYLVILTTTFFSIRLINPHYGTLLNPTTTSNEALNIFNYSFFLISIFIIIFLFILMIIVVKVTSNVKSPIRPFLYDYPYPQNPPHFIYR